MNNVKKLDEDFKKARIEKNDLAKALFSTLKGEYENFVKNGNEPGDASLEKIAKKMIKNAEIVGTEDARKEIELLASYVPEQMGEEVTRKLVKEIMDGRPEVVEEYRAGNKGKVGFLLGKVMSLSHGKADAKVVGRILNEELANGPVV